MGHFILVAYVYDPHVNAYHKLNPKFEAWIDTTSLSRIEEESKITLSDQMLHEVNFTLSNFICKASWMYLDQ